LRLRQLAVECGVCYKPCGAGGGDFGVVFALEPDRLARVERLVADAGFRCLPLAVDEQGLHLEYTGS
jgi:phosphomevalonate kinase